MGPADGREVVALSEALLAESGRFDFFQAVRLLERLAREKAQTRADWRQAPVGRDAAPDEEVVRFRAQTALSFQGPEVVRIGAKDPRPESTAAMEMTVSFLGLTGPQGVLPPHYTALLLQRIKSKDFVFRDFLDLFNHRVVSLFYRAWEKYRLPFSYERAALEGAEVDPITIILYCLVGLGTEGLRGRLSVPD